MTADGIFLFAPVSISIEPRFPELGLALFGRVRPMPGTTLGLQGTSRSLLFRGTALPVTFHYLISIASV